VTADDHALVYQALLDAQNQGVGAALATVIETSGSMPRHAGSKMLIYADGRIVGTIGGGAMEARVIQASQQVIQTLETRLETYTLNSLDAGDPGICGGTARIFIEPVGQTPRLLVIGGGHVGKALAELGHWAGYRVTLCDDRPEYANESYVAGLDEYLVCAPQDVPQAAKIDRHTYIAAVTRGLPVDVNLLPALLATDAPYIGLIGSRRRWAVTMKALRESYGVTTQQLARIHAPIGLELQAETPKEIAISILAEMTMIRRGGTGQPMRWIGDESPVESAP
jgi:xanthine dehydrogenase accessory factor